MCVQIKVVIDDLGFGFVHFFHRSDSTQLWNEGASADRDDCKLLCLNEFSPFVTYIFFGGGRVLRLNLSISMHTHTHTHTHTQKEMLNTKIRMIEELLNLEVAARLMEVGVRTRFLSKFV